MIFRFRGNDLEKITEIWPLYNEKNDIIGTFLQKIIFRAPILVQFFPKI
ncbi:MAG: hypothetical protein JWP78_479 [Mucilaginibacter sp.]|nr:hypothetical protein [Mucilaginibacter sp.]